MQGVKGSSHSTDANVGATPRNRPTSSRDSRATLQLLVVLLPAGKTFHVLSRAGLSSRILVLSMGLSAHV